MTSMTAKSAVLRRLRDSLNKFGLHALVIPHTDAHQSEYIARRDERLAFVSGFTGSSGTAVVTRGSALLWTDNRYFVQAEEELDTSVWTLMKMGEKDVPGIETWLANCGEVPKAAASEGTARADAAGLAEDSAGEKNGFVVGLDAQTSSIRFAQALLKEINSVASTRPKGARAARVLFVHESIVDDVWGDARPGVEGGPVTAQPLQLCGTAPSTKFEAARTKIKAKGAQALLVNSLDDIAWALNLRGRDIPYNPLFFSHLLVDADPTKGVSLFTDASIPQESLEYLMKEIKLELKPYNEIASTLAALPPHYKVWVDPSTCSVALHERLIGAAFALEDETERASRIAMATNPFKLMKPTKSPQEKQGMIRAQRIDALALVRFLSWLDRVAAAPKPKEALDEFSVSEALEGFRRQTSGDAYLGPSFPTIASFGPNGAIVHYRPKPGPTSRLPDLKHGDVFLCDSGGQYRDGTTDTTRTVWVGGPETRSGATFKKVRRAYTGVLKGHVGLASLTFPSGTAPHRLDAMARAPLWSLGLDFKHGVGHGVGAYGCVHELPPLIGSACPANNSDAKEFGGLKPNVCVTNEPGVYIEGEFGIRIESLVFVVPAEAHHEFVRFETVTHVPFCRDLIDVDLLTAAEIAWIDRYHNDCYLKIVETLASKKLEEKEVESVVAWLTRHTEPLAPPTRP